MKTADGSVRMIAVVGFVLAVGLSIVPASSSSSVRAPFPDASPATRAAAVALVAGNRPTPLGCLTPQIQGLAGSSLGEGAEARQTLDLLQRGSFADVERSVTASDGTLVRFADEPNAFDRAAPADLDQNGVPDVVQHVIDGLDRARNLLVESLRLPRPEGLEVVLLELGPDLEGYVIARDDGATIVLDGSPASDGRIVRNAAIHQYAHVVALASGPGMPREWGEALATWATMKIDGGPDGVVAALLSTRLDALGAGLLSRDLELSAGNAIWLAFLDEAYGPAAVSMTVRELAAGAPTDVALDRAIGRISDDDLAAAFREFHLWSILVGPRADRFHFPFAERLAAPQFGSTSIGLPALSVQADPSVGPWGATQIRIVPESEAGGLGLRFEGEFAAHWEADLLLVDAAGTLRRLALDVTSEGWADVTVPLDGVEEALLLIRNLGSADGTASRYTYAAHRERGYPFEIAAFQARPLEEGIDLSWDTASEQELIGFNILRAHEDGGAETVVNPVWIPALGGPDEATSYQFVDRDVRPGTPYVYRVQGITVDGLTSLSEPRTARRP